MPKPIPKDKGPATQKALLNAIPPGSPPYFLPAPTIDPSGFGRWYLVSESKRGSMPRIRQPNPPDRHAPPSLRVTTTRPSSEAEKTAPQFRT